MGSDHNISRSRNEKKERKVKKRRTRIPLAQRIGLTMSSSSNSSQSPQVPSYQHLIMNTLLVLAFGMAACNLLVLYAPLDQVLQNPRRRAVSLWRRMRHHPTTTTTTTAIPADERKIHFIFGLWDSSDNGEEEDSKMPDEFRDNLQLFEDNNPDWQIVKWFSKADIERQVEQWTASSSHKAKQRRYSISNAWKAAKPVQRADLFRYLVLWHQGGWYFDLDVTATADNQVAELARAVELDATKHTAAAFWERGPLEEWEQYESQYSPWRHGRKEYKYRLANYALWSRPKSHLMKCAIQLATYRILQVIERKKKVEKDSDKDDDFEMEDLEQERYSAVLYSSGPDVVTECAFGVRDHYFANTTLATRQDEEEVLRTHITTDHVLVVDPGPNLVNGNTFSWKNEKAA